MYSRCQLLTKHCHRRYLNWLHRLLCERCSLSFTRPLLQLYLINQIRRAVWQSESHLLTLAPHHQHFTGTISLRTSANASCSGVLWTKDQTTQLNYKRMLNLRAIRLEKNSTPVFVSTASAAEPSLLLFKSDYSGDLHQAGEGVYYTTGGLCLPGA